jgi:hypothetical protein
MKLNEEHVNSEKSLVDLYVFVLITFMRHSRHIP